MIPAVEGLLVRPRQDPQQVQQVLHRPRPAERAAIRHPARPPEQLHVRLPRDVHLGLQHRLRVGGLLQVCRTEWWVEAENSADASRRPSSHSSSRAERQTRDQVEHCSMTRALACPRHVVVEVQDRSFRSLPDRHGGPPPRAEQPHRPGAQPAVAPPSSSVSASARKSLSCTFHPS